MDDDPATPEDKAADDPELAALLAFEPVPRRVEREGGWSADNQRAFIALLVETGNYRRAAQALSLTASGVYQLRKDAGAEDFSRAWDEAVALHKARNPRAGPARPARELREARARRAAAEIDPAEAGAMLDEILKRYWLKLRAEREARLAGRIVEADFYLRQLTAIEIMIELGGRAPQLIEQWKSGGVDHIRVVATPATVLIEKLRRAYWREKGEADRPPPPALGRHDGAVALGHPSGREYNAARDGDYEEWRRRDTAKAALAAEAQAAWEEKAREEAEAWTKREEAAQPVPRRRPGSSGAADDTHGEQPGQ